MYFCADFPKKMLSISAGPRVWKHLSIQLWNIGLLQERSILTCRLLYNLHLLPFRLKSLTEILKCALIPR